MNNREEVRGAIAASRWLGVGGYWADRAGLEEYKRLFKVFVCPQSCELCALLS